MLIDRGRRRCLGALGALSASLVAPEVFSRSSTPMPAPTYSSPSTSTSTLLPSIAPSSLVRLVVPFGVGGSTDVLARRLADDLNVHGADRFIVDNKPGAGGTIGTRLVASATPDGRTLLYSTATPFSINPSVYRSLTYDPQADFAPVALTVRVPLVIAVSARGGWTTLQALIDHLRADPAHCSYSSYGYGTSSHICGALFLQQIGVEGVTHIPYKDNAATTDLAAGVNTFQVDAWSALAPMVAAGRITVLATCEKGGMPWIPQVPSVARTLRQDYDLSTWHGVFAPRGTPEAVLAALHQRFTAAMATRLVRQAAIAQGFLPFPAWSREAMAAFVAADRLRWKAVIEAAHIERI